MIKSLYNNSNNLCDGKRDFSDNDHILLMYIISVGCCELLILINKHQIMCIEQLSRK